MDQREILQQLLKEAQKKKLNTEEFANEFLVSSVMLLRVVKLCNGLWWSSLPRLSCCRNNTNMELGVEGRKTAEKHNISGFCCLCGLRVFSRYAGFNVEFVCSFELNNPIEGIDRCMSIDAF